MAVRFRNQVVGGSVLRRPAIQSPDYVPGSAGWAIFIDGSAEFNNGTFRGTVTAATIIGSLIESASSGTRITIDSSGNLIGYNSSGKVIFWLDIAKDAFFFYADAGAAQGALSLTIASTTGTDPVNGSSYQAGFVSYNAATGDYTQIHGGLGITVNDPTNAAFSGGELGLASVSTPNDATQITSPMALASDVQAILALQRAASGGTPVAWFLNTAVVFPKFAFAADPATGAQETWHNMALTGGFSTGTNASNAASDPPQYRLNPDGTVSLRGSLACPGTGTVLGVTFATLPTPYKNTQPNPACAQLIQNNAGHFGGVALNSASQLSLWGNFINSNNIQLDCIVQRR